MREDRPAARPADAANLSGERETDHSGFHYTRPVYIDVEVKAPSGIAHHPIRETVFVASDKGYVVELDDQLRRIVRYEIDGDLEGIAVDHASGHLYLVSEGEGAVLEYAIDTNRIVRTMVVDFDSHPALANKGSGNQGLEGLAFVPHKSGPRLFAVVQSQPACLVELRRAAAADDELDDKLAARIADRLRAGPRWLGRVERWSVAKVIALGIDPLSDVTYDAQETTLIVTSAKEKLAIVCAFDGEERNRFRLPGKSPEGLAVLPNGAILTVDDKGGLWRFARVR